ncbi:MAG: PDZ domain-containing protein [Candidatus Rariloculaceae bacterium]
MRTTAYLASVLVAAASLSVAGNSFAQESEELADAHHELEIARERLEAAAREVARLSTQANEPYVGGVMRDFQMAPRRAMLGINIADEDDGVIVAGVSPGGPAAISGVQTGDVIVAIDTAELTGSDESSPSEALIGYMASVTPGETVTLSIVRDGEEHEIDVEANALETQHFGSLFASPAMPLPRGDFTIMDRPSTIALYNPMGRWADMELVELTEELGAYFGTNEGILVVRAPSDNGLELQDGDVILEIGERVPMSTQHAMRILGSFEPGETLELTIMRSQRRETLELELPSRGRSG